MKKKVLSIALVVAMIAIIAAGSLAYFTDTATATNVFTQGNVDIKLDEAVVTVVDADNGTHTWAAGDERTESGNDYGNVYPGAYLPKDPTVTNTGANAAYIRVTVKTGASFPGLFNYTCGDDFVLGTGTTTEDQFATIFKGYDAANWTMTKSEVDFAAWFSGETSAVFSFVYDATVLPGESVKLFDGIEIPAEFDGSFDITASVGGIVITAEAIQADGFASADEAFAAYDAA